MHSLTAKESFSELSLKLEKMHVQAGFVESDPSLIIKKHEVQENNLVKQETSGVELY